MNPAAQGTRSETPEESSSLDGRSAGAGSIEALCQRAVVLAMGRGAEYADARIVRTAKESLTVHDGSLVEAAAPDEFGIGLRVMKGGAFGFAAAPATFGSLDDVLPGLARRAVAMARDLAPLRRHPIRLAGSSDGTGAYGTTCLEDPFLVPLEDKVGLLMGADAALSGRREIVSRQVSISMERKEQWMATSDGGMTHQVLIRCGGRMAAVASAQGVTEQRSYPNALGGDFRTGGFEAIRALDLEGQGERVRDEAIALCHGPVCPAGPRTLIMGGAQVALQIHETVGSALELDRVLGEEFESSGDSFVTIEDPGDLDFASPCVSFVADSTTRGGLDTRGWDDDGVPSRRLELVREGRLMGLLGGRVSAGRVGYTESGSVSRAEGWDSPPMDRITNLSLVPGSGSLEELIASSEDGTLVTDTVKAWSVADDKRSFQVTSEIAWEVQGGKRSRILRLPTYRGSTLNFWRGCDRVAGPEEWRLHGVTHGRKGNPLQWAEMSHGASPARFRGVEMIDLGR